MALKPETAETIATVALGAAVIAVAYFVIRTPPLRRLAWGLAVAATTRQLPAWLNREVRTAWAESGQRAQVPRANIARRT